MYILEQFLLAHPIAIVFYECDTDHIRPEARQKLFSEWYHLTPIHLVAKLLQYNSAKEPVGILFILEHALFEQIRRAVSPGIKGIKINPRAVLEEEE